MPQIGDTKRAREIGKWFKKGTGSKGTKYIWYACEDCGRERWVAVVKGKPSYLFCRYCVRKGKRFDDVLRKKLSLCNSGANNRRWKGGRSGTTSGYIMVKVHPDDFFLPMATKDCYIMEHRLVMAKHLNRCLLPWEIVHHKNGIRDDNRLENLELLPTNKQHAPSMKWQAEILKRDNQIIELKNEIAELQLYLGEELACDIEKIKRIKAGK
ncbi:hypothetical protein LCGC14_0350250 [marine sediment metagenome]|uniref:HNH nuclease domain-containing protein n=1 Tax=marine sediment metagenome TaxID=412755 RepID=A0A0F9WJ76_9ZZZZ